MLNPAERNAAETAAPLVDEFVGMYGRAQRLQHTLMLFYDSPVSDSNGTQRLTRHLTTTRRTSPNCVLAPSPTACPSSITFKTCSMTVRVV